MRALFLPARIPAFAQCDRFFRAGTIRIENPTHLLETKDFKKNNVIIKKQSVIQTDKITVVMSAVEESLKSSTVVFCGDATPGSPVTAKRGASNPGNRLQMPQASLSLMFARPLSARVRRK